MTEHFTSIDLFSGCGGLTQGMHKAGFKTVIAIEMNKDAVTAFKLNHKYTTVFEEDIRKIRVSEIKKALKGKPLHLLAGCPPCQGFSSIRTLNKKNVADKRNSLVLEYLRFVKSLRPLTIMMENVPGLKNYFLFKKVIKELRVLKYNISIEVVNVKDYGVPQSRKRLVLVGSRLGLIKVAKGTSKAVTVRQTIGKMESVSETADPIHRIFPKHSDRVLRMIKSIKKDGGGRRDLHWKQRLACHSKENIGFNDIYGRLRWDDYSTTITGGCLNPSKGRFLHPTKNRTITAREAALLQSFPKNYKFPKNISRTSIALLIGNALPPKFSFIQSKNIKNHLEVYLKK